MSVQFGRKLVVTLLATALVASCSGSESDEATLIPSDEAGVETTEARDSEISAEPVPLPAAPSAGASAPSMDVCEVLDTYVTRGEINSIFSDHGFAPETWGTVGATSWEEAWGDRWSSTCLFAESDYQPGDEHVGLDLSNYGDGVELAPADHALPALGENGHVDATIGYVVWEQDGWRLSIEGGDSSEDDLQASVELAMLIHDRIIEGGSAQLPAEIDHDPYLTETNTESKEPDAGDGATIDDFFMGIVDFRITTDNGYTWEPTLNLNPPERYADAERAVYADCSESDSSVLGLIDVGIDAGIPEEGSQNDVQHAVIWEFGGFPNGTVISGGDCFDAASGMGVRRSPGDSRTRSTAGYLLLPTYWSPAQPNGDLESFYALTLQPRPAKETAQSLGIDSYEVEVTRVLLGITGEEPVEVDPGVVQSLDGTFQYRLIEEAITAANE